MISREEKQRIARETGAKSKGPTTESGKRKVARNALKHGERADALGAFLPPHFAVLCNEERQDFFDLLDEFTEVFQPQNKFAEMLVRDIAVARWQILRIEICITNHWNFCLLEFGHQPATIAPELAELQVIDKSVRANQDLISRLNRDIDKLHLRIARLERTLRTIHRHYPATKAEAETEKKPEQTNPAPPPPPPQPVQNTEPDPTNPPIYVTENTPGVLAFYKQMFPGRRIVVLPRDNVAKGIEIDDDMPDLPRKVA